MFDLIKDKKYLNNLGLSQQERSSDALRPDYFAIDEIDLDKFIEFISSYSSYIPFYNDQNKLDGDWSIFFTKDSTFSILRLGSFKAREVNKVLTSELLFARKSGVETIKSSTITKVSLELHEILNSFERNILQLSEHQDLLNELKKIINMQLKRPLDILLNIINSSSGHETANFVRDEYSNYWLFEGNEVFSKESIESEFDLTESLSILEELVISTSRVLSKIATTAKNYFDLTLTGSGRIKPHIALLLTFHKLYIKASSELNSITGKHLDYYYKEILKLKPREQEANEVFINFLLDESVKDREIVKGTLLTAGVSDKGEDVFYETQETLIAKEMSLQEVLMIERASSRPKLLPIGNESVKNQIFYLGDSQLLNDKTASNIISESSIGFSFGCDLLNLEEGYRKITFKFLSDTNSFRRFINELTEINSIEGDGIDNEKLNKKLKNAFIVSYFGDEEVQVLKSSRVDCRLINSNSGKLIDGFEIVVLIDIIEPPICSQHTEKVNSEDYPSFQFILNPKRNELYSAFSKLNMLNVDVVVELLEVKNLLLSNDFGPLDPNAPFEPFGSQPSLGASFYIGHPIMFNYSLEDVKLSIEWQGLPGSTGGFNEYYEAYDQIEGNDSFKVKLSALRDRRWFPSENKQVVDLFQSLNSNESNTLSPIRRINELEITSMKLDKPLSKISEITDFSPKSNSGFLRMELCYPLVAFGHELYPELVRKSSFQLAKGKKEQIYPNDPHVPIMKSITADFKMKMSFDLSKNSNHSFKHIHPFGVEIQSNNNNKTLPLYNEGSSLIMGFKLNSQNKIIASLIQLSKEFSPDKLNGLRLDWSVWVRNCWSKLSPSELLSDGTMGFTKSGIIQFNIERAMSDSTGLFNPELFWIKCDSSSGHSFLEGILDVLPNAVAAKCITPERLNEPNISEYKITDLKDEIEGVKEVLQKYPSFGGRNKESNSDFYTRVSERLKHKNRAISVSDYENILLERFDTLHRVKCFSNTNDSLEFCPGNAVLTVIPHLSLNKNDSLILKYFSIVELNEMHDYLESRVPFGAKLTVINPIYEKIRTKFNVKFNSGLDPTFYVKKLNGDIKKYLSPFISNDAEKLMFGKSIQSTKILSFIDKLDYVDFVLNFSVFHVVSNVIINYNEASSNSLEIKPSTEVSILISDDNHKISVYDDSNVTDVFGINEMMIETDYIVESQEENNDKLSNGYIGKNYRIHGENSDNKKEFSKFTLHLNLDK